MIITFNDNPSEENDDDLDLDLDEDLDEDLDIIPDEEKEDE